MPDTKPPLTAELVWADQLRFGATSGPNAIVVDSDGAAGSSPMQLAAFGLAGAWRPMSSRFCRRAAIR
jgi:hypothetical protein